MLNNRRSELEIIKDILHISQDGVKKTEILYKGNLSFVQLNIYIALLVDKGLMEERLIKNNGSQAIRKYHCTPKGGELLSSIDKTISFFM